MNIKFTTKPNMLILIVSVVLFITIFLPWYTVSAFGFSASTNGFHNGGILTFLMSLVGVALAFIEILPKYKVLATGGAGILALLGVIIAMTQLGGTSMGFGMIIALIASMALIAVGFLEGRKIKMFVPKAGTTPPPPPPPPPPAPPAQQ